MNRLEESNDASLSLYIEDSAELQLHRPTGMLNKVHMHLYLYSISPNDHLPNFYRYGEGVGRGGHILFRAPKVRPDRGSNS